MKSSLRSVLAETHVADVVIAWLALRALESAFWVVWIPLAHAAGFVFMAIAIMDIPYHSSVLDPIDRMQLMEMSISLISALSAAASAWVLSRWVYGLGPIRSLSDCGKKLKGSSHA